MIDICRSEIEANSQNLKLGTDIINPFKLISKIRLTMAQ